jgi:hypothetical protein
MVKLGYKLMSEEHGPTELVRNAKRAEQAGFEFAAISDHFFPWLEEQGHAPFAWSVLGALANATERLGLAAASKHVSAETVAQLVSCGPSPDRHLKAIDRFIEAGYDHVILVQVGPEQDAFIEFFERDLAPALRQRKTA